MVLSSIVDNKPLIYLNDQTQEYISTVTIFTVSDPKVQNAPHCITF